MSVTSHERPEVYFRYDVFTVVKDHGGGRCAGLAALYDTGMTGTLYIFNRYEETVTVSSGEEILARLVRLLFLNDAAQVRAVPVVGEAGYGMAFPVLEVTEDIVIMICNSSESTVQRAL